MLAESWGPSLNPVTRWLSESSPSDKVALASSIIALVAVILGPIISIIVARRQFEVTLQISREQSETAIRVARQQVVAPMRQKWIDDLRERISEFFGEITWFEGPSPKAQHEISNHGSRLVLLINNIQLMLNLTEIDHQELLKCLGKVFSYSVDPTETGVHFSPKEKRAAVGDLQKICAKVLKSEWERVKQGD